MKKMTSAEYKEKLTAKFGVCTLVGNFQSVSKPVGHKCTSCDKEFLVTPHSMLHYKLVPTCIECSKKNRAALQATPRAEFISKLKVALPNIKCLKFKTNHKPAKFKCTCGNTWNSKPYEILKLKVGCPKCARAQAVESTKLPIEEIKKRLAKKNIVLRSTKRYEKRVDVGCKKCGHGWSANPEILTPGNTNGCPECYIKRKQIVVPSDKIVQLGKRKVVVQGYEPQVLKFLTATKKIEASKIKVATEGIGSIQYMFLGEEHTYYPDIRIGSRYIEVKSTYTLFADLEKNKAKAKACLKQGFKFKMVVVEREKVIALPEEWLGWKQPQIESFIRAKARGSKIRILALDPGSTNFGWAVLEVSNKFDVKVLASGTIDNPIKSLVGNVVEVFKPFKNEIEDIVSQYNVDHVIAERYMTRGLKGTTIELISMMIAIATLVVRWRTSNVLLIPASQWKNEFNKLWDLEEFYKKVCCVDHQVDAVMIGIYGAHIWFNEKPFSKIEAVSLIEQINNTNLGKVINESRRNNSRKNKSGTTPKRTTAAATKRSQKAFTRTTKQKPKSRRASTRTRATPTAPQRQSAKTKQRGRQSTKAATGRRTVRKERATKRGT